jgi:hypothetical protein
LVVHLAAAISVVMAFGEEGVEGELIGGIVSVVVSIHLQAVVSGVWALVEERVEGDFVGRVVTEDSTICQTSTGRSTALVEGDLVGGAVASIHNPAAVSPGEAGGFREAL